MNRLIIHILIGCLLGVVAWANSITVPIEKSAIVMQEGYSPTVEAVAKDLQHHLKLVTGVDVPLVAQAPKEGLHFYIGEASPDDQEMPLPREGRCAINAQGVYFYGAPDKPDEGIRNAIYYFLEKELGIRWLYPGDEGIVYHQQNPLKLTEGEYHYQPKLAFGKIRQSIRLNQPHRPIGYPSTDPFLLTMEEHNRRVKEEELWIQRMRMGGSRPGGGHAFSDWWEKYHETYPEIFALSKEGKREPVVLPKAHQTNEFVKICPSNPKVAELLIQEWLPRKDLIQYISTGPDDGHNFCRCDACMALDARPEGEKFPGQLTDRYLYMTNEVARQARQIRPDAFATLYGYLTTLQPPRRVKAEPNVLIMLVPYVIPLETQVTEDLFAGWREAGVNHFGFRPNYQHKYNALALPLGFEKQYFDVFQVAYRNGAISADYDMMLGHWAVTGMMNYILARAMVDPEKGFAYWEDEYCATYGAAADGVKAYHRYWREELWEKRLLPDLERINGIGRAGNFCRGLASVVGDYYTEADFDATDALLATADAQQLTVRERARLRQEILVNQHARLVYRAASQRGQERYANTLALNQFRLQHKDDLNLSWVRLIGQEARYNVTAVELAAKLQAYPLPWLQTGMAWHFKMDPDDVGLKEHWQRLSAEQTESWEQLRVDSFWENAYDSETEPGLKKRLANYDGVAWYSSKIQTPQPQEGRRWYMVIGGVGDACQVYVNGQEVGTHEAASEADKKQPFRLRIDPAINWRQPTLEMTIRVNNRSGLGGLYDRIWVVSQDPEPTP